MSEDDAKEAKAYEPQIDTGSDIAKVQKACARTTVNLYANSVHRQADQQALIKLWTQYGLKTQLITVGSRAQPANSIWHGSDVPDGCWREVAFSMTRAGVYVRDLGSPEHDGLTHDFRGEARIVERAFGIGVSALAEAIKVFGEKPNVHPA